MKIELILNIFCDYKEKEGRYCPVINRKTNCANCKVDSMTFLIFVTNEDSRVNLVAIFPGNTFKKNNVDNVIASGFRGSPVGIARKLNVKEFLGFLFICPYVDKEKIESTSKSIIEKLIELHEERAMQAADYTYSIKENTLVIIDENLGNISVTNDIENVLYKIFKKDFKAYTTPNIIYRDSDLLYCKVYVDIRGRFLRFEPLLCSTLEDALKKIGEFHGD